MQMCPSRSHDNRDSARFCTKCQTQLLGLLGANTLLQGPYRELKVLGCGGMSAVYLAEDNHLAGKQVAIKENLDISPGAQAQFQREAAVLASLAHPNLPTVTGHFIEANGRQYLVMQYIQGRNLLEIAAADWGQGRSLGQSRVLGWAMQIMDALEYLHGQRPYPVLHRDMKPANLVLTSQWMRGDR